MAKESHYHQAKHTWSQAVSEIMVAAMNKGQFPVALLGLIMIIYLIRVPQERLIPAGQAVWQGLEAGWVVGYLLFVVTLFGAIIALKRQRRTIDREMRRVTKERNELQAQLMGRENVATSGERR